MPLKDALENYGGDVYIYYGGISREGYDALSQALEKKQNHADKACLILVTYGGNPDAGYRIARAMRHYYETVEILIPDACKSAGTLICIGGNKLIFGDRGELGPLDIQLSKPDEMFENMSGLDIIQALNALENQVLKSFRTYLVDIRGGCRLRTKIAADIATKLADGFIAPIAAKIDPLTLGEHQRAMQIACDYGERLSKVSNSLLPGALVRLVASYPSHGFVIDRKEAKELFREVHSPDDETIGLYLWARIVIESTPMPDQPIVLDVATQIPGNEDGGENEDNSGNENDHAKAETDNEADNGGAAQEGQGNEPTIAVTA